MKKIILINVLSCGLVFFLFQGINVLKVQGDSMAGIINDGKKVVTVSPNLLFPVKRGDIVSFEHFKNGQSLYP